tara:strand:- start:336 stop:476 length:141 start_codon:yes stop_codon:yes gene_type:complete
VFGLGILKGTIMGIGIGFLAGIAVKEACKKSTKNKMKANRSSNLEE